ncbi:hypothetical protein [Malikia sp.]|uniref:hypothetical protein n=1 Tax=Malikia sp. TaxID=2070706 RepID=UPI002635316C|nr:hypothetical protein [Malikia sp.]MDD2728411.1 hypothetical protein [Malikia sp.]
MTAKFLSDLLGNKLLLWTLVIGINAVGIASVVGIPVALLVDLILVLLGIRWLVNRVLPASAGDVSGKTPLGRSAARLLLFVLLLSAVVVATGHGYQWLIHSTFWLI